MNALASFRTAFRSLAYRLYRSDDGIAAVEFGLIAPFLAVLLVGTVNLGMMFDEKIRIASAARAGAHYGTTSLARSFDTPGMENAARTDADDASNKLDVSASRYCVCPETGAVVLCTESCFSGDSPRTYVSVTVARYVPYLLPIPGFGGGRNVAETVEMRVR